ncbi:nuclear pore membrane glycoprotein 210-like isoform X3 [Scyliorhinus canicula]|uniref:nuclear pore membrane glycoprotein 210-like isoform X3 n=1 Tax=Scyliorhinus canicula TaxID=7830 RepID=UPI0018F6378B|nr:nuclear pore membrane glycoprotein 210-like isoform X3 [Scyliorhinus canicula]
MATLLWPGLLYVVAVLRYSAGAKLNVPKVLLPYSANVKANFTLEADEGCYQWFSTRPDVATIEPVYQNACECSNTALISVRSTQPTRLTSIIIAEETVTGQVLRCDVMVDLINQIEIVSTTRELYVDDSLLKLTVRALDEEGNTFSSLEGFIFEWSIMKNEDMNNIAESPSKIRIMKFSESTYLPPEHITRMEKEGKQGDIILVSGLMTGTANLKTRLQDSIYKNVPAAVIRVIILENIVLSPAHDIYLLIGAFIRYTVAKVVNGKMTEIQLPSEQYKLELQDNEVSLDKDGKIAELDPETCVVTALQKGQASLVLIYKNIYMQALSHLPNCTIYVVEAGFLGFSVLPGDRWFLEVGRKYAFTVEVYDKSSNKIYLSDNLNVATTLPELHFTTLVRSINGTYLYVDVTMNGKEVIRATLFGVVGESLLIPITNQQEVMIYEPIILKPKILVFPWHPKPRSYRHLIQVVIGGSGNFTWSSCNESVALVTVKGVIATGDNRGFSIIQAWDVDNPIHYGKMRVNVVRPVSIEFVRSRVEIEVGQTLDLPIMVYGLLDTDDMETVPVNDCSLMNLAVETDKQGVFKVIQGILEPDNVHCTGISIQAESPGHTILTASAGFLEVHFSSSTTIASYHRLRAIDPVAVAIVTLTASKEMLFEGGPRPWVLEPSGFYTDLSGEKRDAIIIQQQQAPSVKKKNHHGFRVTCVTLGEQFLTFKVGNHPSLMNPYPAIEPIKVKFVCAVPTSVTLAPVYKSRELGLPCPLLQHNKQLVPVSFCRNTILELTAFDQYGRKFDNFTSLQINWKSSNFSLGSFHPEIQMEMFLRDDGSGQKRLHGHRMVIVYKRKGTVSITVNVVGYRKTNIAMAKSPVGVLFLPITATIDLLLVDDVSLVPRNLTVYNHPDILEIVYLTEGSGYFFVNTTDTEILTSTYLETKNYVHIRPLQPGIVTMKAYDLCLTCKGPARAEIYVSDILDFELDFIHKVEIGKSVPVNVRILDFYKKPLLNRYFRCMNITLQAASPIVTLETITDLDKHAASYLIRAVALGQTTLVTSARDKNGRKLSSAPRQVEVFPPFRLIPRRVTLIIGGMMQVMSEGGPQPQSNIYFSISNHTIAKVNELGQLTALVVGTAKVIGIVQAVDDDTGKVVVFSQDEVTVDVIQLKGIKIHAPVTRLRTGTQLPVYAIGVTSCQTPFSFGNAVPGLSFHWTTTKREVIELVSRHSEISLQLSAEHNFAMLLYSKAEGKTGLKVTIKAQNPSAGQFGGYVDRFSDEIQIMVFGILQLLPLPLPAEEVLMSPNSCLKLQTSRDGKAYVNYEVRKCPHNKSVIMEDGHGVLTSGSRTGSSALTVTSLEYFGLNQTIVTGVRVAPVAYLSINTSPKLYIAKNEELAALPLGMTLTFTVNFYDLSGDQFHAHNTKLYLALNRDDLLLIGPGTRNNTYVAQAANTGLTLLAVWDNKHPGIADYIPIPTEYAIWPNISEHVTLSDIICFSSVLVNQEGEPGNWYLLSSEVLQIDPATGLGVTRSTGSTMVYYEIPGSVKTYREITVTGVGKATVSFHGFTCMIGLPNFHVYRFLVTTMNKDSSLRGDCSFAQVKAMSKLKPESNLACSVRFSNIALQFLAPSVFSVEPEFLTDTGQYSCTVIIKEIPDSVRRELSTGGDTYVSVKASVLGGHYAGQVGRTEIPFIPGFYMNQSSVTLSYKEPTVNITIFGVVKVLNELEIRSQSPAIVVSPPVQLYSVPNIVYSLSTVNLSLLQQGFPCTNISVSSPLTRQVMHVTVTVLRSGGNGGTTGELPFEESTFFDQLVESYQVLMFTLFAVLATTAIIFIAYNAFLTRIQTIPVIYVSTSAQTGYSSAPPCSNPRRRYLQSWLWSVR